MKHLVWEYVQSFTKKIANTYDIEEFVCSKLEQHFSEQAFADSINSLVEEGILLPVVSRGSYGDYPTLYGGYRITESTPIRSRKCKKLLEQLHPHLSTIYYETNPDHFFADKRYIMSIDTFLKSEEGREQVTVQQRSYLLFQDEGLLIRRRGLTLLKRLGLDYTKLRCYQPAEPFVYSINYPLPQSKLHLLVVEGKDTYHIVRSFIAEGKERFLPNQINVLIYGDGDHIANRLDYFSEINPLQRAEPPVFHYFGDVSYERFHFLRKLQRTYPAFDIRPCVPLYQELVSTNWEKAAVTKSYIPTKEKEQDVQDILSYFPRELAVIIQKIFKSGKYIPQIALTRSAYEHVLEASGASASAKEKNIPSLG